jgi:hypothetical protein
MQSTLALRDKMATLLAADIATLAVAANPNMIVLIKAAFTPGENMPFGSLVPADFDGSSPLAVGLNAQPEALDPATSDSRITLKPPAGGWRWQTSGVTNLPQTIYGVALMVNDLSSYYASQLFPVPIVLTATDQVIDIGPLELLLPAGSLR